MIRKFLLAIFTMTAFGASAALAADLKAGEDKVKAVCQACHGADGNSQSTDYPKLGGQYPDYLAKALRDYKSGARKNPIMHSPVRSRPPTSRMSPPITRRNLRCSCRGTEQDTACRSGQGAAHGAFLFPRSTPSYGGIRTSRRSRTAGRAAFAPGICSGRAESASDAHRGGIPLG